MHETIWHSLIVAFTIIVQKLDLTFNSIASRRAAFCESRESKHSIMCNKTKGRYQKYKYHMQSMCLSESYRFLIFGFVFFQCFCGILKLN